MLFPQLCWCCNQNKKAMTPIRTHAGHHYLLHVTSRPTTLHLDVTLTVAAKDMHIYAASGTAEDSVCLQYDAVLCNRFPTFRRKFMGLEIRDEVNSLRQSTLMKVEHVPSKLRELISQCRGVFRRRTESSKIYARIHTTERQTQINLSPTSNLQDNSSPLTSTPFMYNRIFLSSTSNSISLELSNQFHGPAKTAVSELYSPLGNVFTHAHHVLQNKLIISYQRPTSEAPKSIFEASAENELNTHHKCTASKRTKRA